MRHAIALLLLLSSSTGCESLYDTYRPVAVEFLIYQVEHSIDSEIDFDPTYADGHVSVRAYLSEADQLDEVGVLPAEDAVVLLWGKAMGTLEIPEQGGGLYYLDNLDNAELRYDDKHEYELSVVYAGKEHKSWVWLPESPWTDVSDTHTANQAMNVHLDPEDFDNAMAVSIASDGSVLFDDSPTNLEELMEFTSHSGVGTYTIPSEAFPSPQKHQAVGVGGLRVSRGEENYEDYKHDICRMAAGSVELSLVEVD